MMDNIRLTPQQLAFIDTFGYLSFPELLKDKIEIIQKEFEAVWTERGGGMDGKPHAARCARSSCRSLTRANIFPVCLMIRVSTVSSAACWARTSITSAAMAIFMSAIRPGIPTEIWAGGSIGTPRLKYYKMAFYLDPLTRSNGALRVIPGSHRFGEGYAEGLEKQIRQSQAVWGISGAEVPAIPLETTPGDVVVFNFATKHSAWGGGNQRRNVHHRRHRPLPTGRHRLFEGHHQWRGAFLD